MRFTLRSRVLFLAVPVFIFLVITYPYFRSFSPTSSPPPGGFQSAYKPPPQHDDTSPRPGYVDYYPLPSTHPKGNGGDPVQNIPVLDTDFSQPDYGKNPSYDAGHSFVTSFTSLETASSTASPLRPTSIGASRPFSSPSGSGSLISPSASPTSSPTSVDLQETSSPLDAQVQTQPTEPAESLSQASGTGARPFPTAFGHHPIDDLIQIAISQFDDLQKKETRSLKDTAAAYRKRRARHPPPGFDKWYEFAKEKDALIIEEFFDPIYDDTEPFWGRAPADLRSEPSQWSVVATIRNGSSKTHNNIGGNRDWVKQWQDMLKPVIDQIPDMDLAFNSYDEPRVIAPWETINKYMTEAQSHRNLEPPDRLIMDHQSLPALSTEDLSENREKAWEDSHKRTTYWQIARSACHPDSVARSSDLDKKMNLPPEFPEVVAEESYRGYVANATHSRNLCLNPHLRNLHGNFVRPRFNSVNTSLFPMFAGSKHEGINNEIRVPAARYWSSGATFGGADDVSTVDADGPKVSEDGEAAVPWSDKSDTVFWRGSASGGAHDKATWRRFHRHRFISMLNGTQVTMTERKLDNMTSLAPADLLKAEPALPHNFPIPNSRVYPLAALATNPTKLGDWLEPLTDAAFTHTMCSPQALTMLGKGLKCRYTDPFYEIAELTLMAQTFEHKYLPDIDGFGYSGRYRSYLRSGSLPIKATVHAEWHDSRLVPWLHYVPMDNTFADFYSILEYFVGHTDPDADDDGGDDAATQGGNFFSEWLGWAGGGHDGGGTRGHRILGGAHDDVAQAMAEQGREWSRKVLRKEDMVVYMFRLMLEWARITNDRRDEMGWAEDLR